MTPETVDSRIELAQFIDHLRHNVQNLESRDLPSFLEALSAYARDVDGYYANAHIDVDADQASWRVFADILKGASIYE